MAGITACIDMYRDAVAPNREWTRSSSISFHRHVIFLLLGQRRREERSGLGGGCRERGQFIFPQWNGFDIFISEFIGQKLFASIHKLRMKMKDVRSIEVEDDHGVSL